MATLPDGSAKADELALDYDHFVNAVLANFSNEFSLEQATSLRRINGLLEAMSNGKIPSFGRRKLS